LEVEVVEASGGRVVTRVKTGGVLLQEKGINLPDTDLKMPALTEKDVRDIAAVVRASADYMSLSFVQTPEDMLAARREAEKHGRCPRLIAKIEKPKAVERFAEILEVSDGIMVARGDLGVEMSPAKVPVLQKRFISEVNSAGKTVITATQMLESMISNPRPTRAEASDVANAVWDGTDAVMLSGETAVGRYPVETVNMMRSIIMEAEKAAAPKREPFRGKTRIHALASSAVAAANDLCADAIVAITVSGFTAQMVAQQRPSASLIAVVPDEHVRNCLALLWGTLPVAVKWSDSTDEFLARLERELVEGGYISIGSRIILVSGSTKLRGIDYMMKIHDVGAGRGAK
jgi:pyruvate kinase